MRKCQKAILIFILLQLLEKIFRSKILKCFCFKRLHFLSFTKAIKNACHLPHVNQKGNIVKCKSQIRRGD